jgi:hypothetical protein
MRRIFLFLCVLALACPAWAQQASDEEILALVHKQFGPDYKLVTSFPVRMVTSDFDGDGIEDAAIIARSKDPIGPELDFGYKVVDPYDAYWGYGDPKNTLMFNQHNWDEAKFLLVIHGAGEKAWRAETPKLKWVLINTPFDEIAVSRKAFKKKKKAQNVMQVVESRISSSTLYWDGKKWKWEPNTEIMDE